MPFVKVNIHFVWATKNRVPLLDTLELREQVWKHIRENGRDKGIHVDFVSGYDDHCHSIISLGFDQTISKVMQLIKGESAFWINQNGLCRDKFGWQDEYFGVSVSESMLDKTRDYLRNQEEHHKHKAFKEEYDELLKKFNFKKLG